EQMALSRRPYVTWYGWEGDRLVTVQTAQSRIQTVYQPGSFTPLVRIETPNAAREKARHRSLVEVLQQEGSEDGQGVVFPAELVRMLDRLEDEIRQNAVSEESRAWLAGCGLTVEQMAAQMEEAPEPQRKIHLYHCDHRGLPLALVDTDTRVAWSAGYDEWGNMLREENPQVLEQLIRLPGQQYDEESGLYYNRNRYYNPGLGRYITQDPVGLEGGINPYVYPLNPVQSIDPLGLTLIAVNLPGLGDTYLDDSFYTNVQSFITNASDNGVELHFNSAYRSPQHQADLHNDPNAITPADHSLHSCGFAVDVNYSVLSNSQQEIIRKAATDAGLDWGGEFRRSDPPHFYIEPSIDRNTAIDNATQEYLRLTGVAQ
ncbi:MAG: RHS repeat-associated core domain-containing protein, partial [Acinetobacter sp.]